MNRLLIHLPGRLLFLLGLAGGSQLPKFIGDYRQHLAGRLAQARDDLALFQAIADRFHQGDLEALIRLHLESPVASFRAEGEAIRQLSEQVTRLGTALGRLDGSLLQQIPALFQGDPELLRATWRLYQPGLLLTPEALLCALLAALALGLPPWLLLQLRRRKQRRRPLPAGEPLR